MAPRHASFNPQTHVSPNFSWAEFACRDYFHTPYPQDWRDDRAVPLAAELEALRERCAQIACCEVYLILNSCFRTVAHNALVGGKKRSMHLEGRAADVMCPHGMTYDQFRQALLDVAHRQASKIRYLKFYPHQGFAHLDIRLTTRFVVEEDTAA